MDIGVNLCIQSECRKMGTRKNSVSGHFSSCLRHCCATLPTLNCINFYCLSFHFIYLLYHLSSCFLLPKKLFFMIHNLLNSSPTSRKKIVPVALQFMRFYRQDTKITHFNILPLRFKVGLSPSKKICFTCLHEDPLKMIKNAFCFI